MFEWFLCIIDSGGEWCVGSKVKHPNTEMLPKRKYTTRLWFLLYLSVEWLEPIQTEKSKSLSFLLFGNSMETGNIANIGEWLYIHFVYAYGS